MGGQIKVNAIKFSIFVYFLLKSENTLLKNELISVFLSNLSYQCHMSVLISCTKLVFMSNFEHKTTKMCTYIRILSNLWSFKVGSLQLLMKKSCVSVICSARFSKISTIIGPIIGVNVNFSPHHGCFIQTVTFTKVKMSKCFCGLKRTF